MRLTARAACLRLSALYSLGHGAAGLSDMNASTDANGSGQRGDANGLVAKAFIALRTRGQALPQGVGLGLLFGCWLYVGLLSLYLLSQPVDRIIVGVDYGQPRATCLNLNVVMGLGIVALLRPKPTPFMLGLGMLGGIILSSFAFVPEGPERIVSQDELTVRALVFFLVQLLVIGSCLVKRWRSFARIFTALCLTALVLIQVQFHIVLSDPTVISLQERRLAQLEQVAAITDQERRNNFCAALTLHCWSVDAGPPAEIPRHHYNQIDFAASSAANGRDYEPAFVAVDEIESHLWHYRLVTDTADDQAAYFVVSPPQTILAERIFMNKAMFIMSFISSYIWMTGTVLLILFHNHVFSRRGRAAS